MSTISSKTVSGLDLDYTFELIPDCPAATAAGYTAEDRAVAQVWYKPIVDNHHFYYTAWSGSILAPTHLSSILVCRRKCDGALKYAVNCHDYDLDTSPNFLGDNATICRCKLLLVGKTLYLCNAVMSNIGPQLYAVNKHDGSLKWAAAYYTPEGAPSYVTTRGDYSQYRGSNHRISDLNPVGDYLTVGGVQGKYVFVGSSSFQNAINVGFVGGGFEKYTDQGFLFCIKDKGDSSELSFTTPTCAPLLEVGDQLTKGGEAKFDPFSPNQSSVTIQSLSGPDNYFLSPKFLASPPAPADSNTCPVIANVFFDASTSISSSLVQPLWKMSGIAIYEGGDRSRSCTLSELVKKWKAEQKALQPGESVNTYIWAYLSSSQMDKVRQQSGNDNVLYFKELFDGDYLANEFDAQGINYWGNSTWGAEPVLDYKRNMILFASGQAHAAPASEDIYYSNATRNFMDLKTNVIDTLDSYVQGSSSLDQLNAMKRTFTDAMRVECLNTGIRSPRSQMSYSDGAFGVYLSGDRAGEIAFAVRSVPWDTYSFLNSGSLAAYPLVALDGDASSGFSLYEGIVGMPAKSGITAMIDTRQLNGRKFDHNNLSKVGVEYFKMVFNGPNGLLGGSNFQAAQNGRQIVSGQANMAWFGGSVSSTGNLESEVTPSGRHFEVNNSFIQGVDASTGKILWNTPLENRAHAEITAYNGLNFLCDGNGSLYVIDSHGQIVWKYDGTQNQMYGGINSPAVTETQVFWTAAYNAFGIIGTPSPNGCVFKVNPDILIGSGCPRKFFAGKTYKSWDTAPKALVQNNPAINPVQAFSVENKWGCKGVKYTHYNLLEALPPISGKAWIKSHDPQRKVIKFSNPHECSAEHYINYYKAELINTHTYRLVFYQWNPATQKAERRSAWMKL